MIPTKHAVQKHVEETVVALKLFAKSKFNLDVDNMVLKITFNECKRIGIAGTNHSRVPFMKLNLGALVRYPVLGYSEYRSYAASSKIGGFDTTDWRVWLEALVYHEFAHVMQFSLHTHMVRQNSYYHSELGRFESGHGAFFQRIYSMLRDEFLNHRIVPLCGNPKKTFDRPIQVSNFPADLIGLIGQRVRYRNTVYTLIEYDPRRHKYPLLGVSNNGRRLKMPVEFAQANMV